MPDLLRIFSDVHFGDRSSQVRQLAHLRPLLDGADGLILNGDTLDTRPGPDPAMTAALRAEVLDFFGREVPAVTFLTGNHDANISSQHQLDLARGKVFVVHGDILFDNIVPWSRDAPTIARLLAAELASLSLAAQNDLASRLAVWRSVAGKISQRQESERNPLKHTARLLADTVWPPWRVFRILRAWREEPARASALLRRHRPAAKFILTGHTHRPGVTRMPDGTVSINSGSFCLPLGSYVSEVSPTLLRVRRVARRRREFHLGETIAEFPL